MSATAAQATPARTYRETLATWSGALAAGTLTPRDALRDLHRNTDDLRLIQRLLRDMNWPRGANP